MFRNRTIAFIFLVAGAAIMAAPDAGAQPGGPPLSVPRTLDLAHVEPANYAAALGRDPARIFEFVRDQIGHEVYSGVLRGPRGTLLAMAGNSVDRSLLLASLLEHSGHKVRYVQGSLPEASARALAGTMWTRRQRPITDARKEPTPADKAAADTAAAAIKRDYETIRAHLKNMPGGHAREPALGLSELAREAQSHFWVEWQRDGTWVTLDPAFADATIGNTRATPQARLEALPPALFHQVNIKVVLEEYAVMLQGSERGTPTQREILSHSARAADLSGADVVFTHHPENWRGPTRNLQDALASALSDTGLMKPVLLTGRNTWVHGKSFRQIPPPAGGMGGMAGMLSGAGTRNPVPVATAERVEIELVSPDGRKQTVTREIFDLVGKARRAENNPLTMEEARTRAQARSRDELGQGIYSLHFSTGGLDRSHIANVAAGTQPGPGEPSNAREALRHVAIAFLAVADATLARIGDPGGPVTLFYPDSPRIHIVEMRNADNAPRFAIDLRHTRVRAATSDSNPETAFRARVLRGVVEGTLERILAEMVTSSTRENGWSAILSTSSVFELAQAQGVKTVLVDKDSRSVAIDASQEIQARLRDEVARGHLLVVPQRAIAVANQSRLAWWRIDPRSGMTVGVTDDGLHAGTPIAYYQRVNAALKEGELVEVWLVYQVSALGGAGARYVVVHRWVSWIQYLFYTELVPRITGN